MTDTVKPPKTRLGQWLDDNDRTGAWLGRKLGLTRQTVNEWIRGVEPVPPARRAQIAIHTGRHDLFDTKGYAIKEADAMRGRVY